ncbi:Glycopeptide antibiotics resistance protein [Streptococcus sp. 45]|jgi:glycopeptide antibiotics resistance protein|uniref:Glycopeptide antibiotics resistance protein n=1 Tax=Streptococcus equinus JB1 TaxID=1294274 RepID=A0A091BN29_STREI|nr:MULTISPECIES: VanZ family protein [Streptococcus]MDY2776141.1 VanZ family protein [Streptococcus infantarius]KFN87086.1 VanZF-like protein [Streptococcus equinus JB1]SEI55587.1 Glycopeptide antibiotics resistance protein [Streptococcus sp. 45]SFC17854.1 Glycopeptide antibiotics resistance protein [Streptococcus equinus]SFL37633.1 Glycopeptide antibiotics resistance protein [Streptococcus equinus JB1]
MRKLFDEELELTSLGRKVAITLVGIYILALCFLCFSPQPFKIDGVETPNIIYYGRLRLLLVPFNSLIGIGQLDSAFEAFWVFAQNVTNMFLIFPLMLGLIWLFPKLRHWKRAWLFAFGVSLVIETTQLLVDLLYNANRVFEIDDLWTNSLGGLLALGLYTVIYKKYHK